MAARPRNCDHCQAAYLAKGPGSKFCGPACRKASWAAARAAESRAARDDDRESQESQADDGGCAEAVRAELFAANVLDSSAGRAALALARLVDGATSSDSAAAAAWVREMRAAVADALKGARPAASDPLDEMARRRAARAV